MKKPAIPARRILVVDDEPFVSDAVKMLLKFDGHRVDTATSGQEALDLFATEKYDLVITDYAMPDMKGDELALALKARTPGQPVVLITAYAEMLKATHHPLAGVDFIISKPFQLENLREAVSKATAPPSEPEANG